jgi:hypothetical protein
MHLESHFCKSSEPQTEDDSTPPPHHSNRGPTRRLNSQDSGQQKKPRWISVASLTSVELEIDRQALSVSVTRYGPAFIGRRAQMTSFGLAQSLLTSVMRCRSGTNAKSTSQHVHPDRHHRRLAEGADLSAPSTNCGPCARLNIAGANETRTSQPRRLCKRCNDLYFPLKVREMSYLTEQELALNREPAMDEN